MSCNGSAFKISANGLPVFSKSPGARLDYGFDLAVDPWLAQGETITSATWVQSHAEGVAPLVLDGESIAGGVVLVWVSGGVLQKEYRLTVTFVTSAGRTDSRSLILQIRER